MLIQGNLIPLNTGTVFPTADLKPTSAKRVLHNGSNYLVADLSSALNPSFYYYQTNGVQTASYIATQDYIFDVAFNSNKYYTARAAVSGSNIIGIIIEEITSAGAVLNNVINYLNVVSGTTTGFLSLLPNIELVVSDYAKMYIRVNESIYDLPASGSLFPTTSGYTDSDININILNSGINSTHNSLLYSRKDSHFIGLVEYLDNLNVIKMETWSVISGNSPTYKDRQLFIESPTITVKSNLGSLDNSSFFYNELDHNTLYTIITNTGINSSSLFSYNVDSNATGFASVNLNDMSLRAGTGDFSTVTAEVINAWGEPLNNKQVTFALTQGDGTINPASVNTNVSGIASSLYTAGIVAGTVTIEIEVAD